ncbi:MAG: HAMP domain-containing histidine kinase [Lachnospiraceae bacterium]|nr:HAMP domain-containing histidine kinase [Lachnospiraceae bacterium]
MTEKKENNTISFFHSIRFQFMIALLLLLLFTLGVCELLNTGFLDRYYRSTKVKALKQAYDTLNAADLESISDSDEFDAAIRRVSERNNISLIVLDTDTETLTVSGGDSEFMTRQLLSNIFEKNGAIRGMDGAKNSVVIEETDDYEIRTMTDPVSGTGFIEMWGTLDNGNLFMLRTSLESIRESAALSNRFFLYAGLLALALGVVVSFFVSKKITGPIREITTVSERLKEMDFEAKYTGDAKNEIGILGRNINDLSEKLETNISELRTANNSLELELEKKNEINEEQKEFLSSVSHELKTPIALIQGYAEGIKDQVNEDPESIDFYIDVIIDEARRMNGMVKQIMTLSSMESAVDKPEMTRFDISVMIRNYIRSSDILIRNSNVSVTVPEESGVFVWGDEIRVEEVFMNYFSNALNHADGERRIHVKLSDVPGNKVRISVFNTGDPIPAESLGRIWDRFYKVDKARSREYGGSGVGLSIVKAAMESMGQKYGANNYDDGVEFWFELDRG